MSQKRRLDDFFKPEEKSKKKPTRIEGSESSNTFFERLGLFFKDISERNQQRKRKNQREKHQSEQSAFLRKARILFLRVKRKLVDMFNFESDVDVLNQVSVLYRRNKVNKNILFVANIVFIIFTFIGNQKTNYILIASFAILMLLINQTLKRIINETPRTLVKQQVAMYLGSIYILVASIAVYIKLMYGAGAFSLLAGDPTGIMIDLSEYSMLSITQAGYILIYFALVIVSLYQDPKLLRFTFTWVIGIMTILHIFVMYPVLIHEADSIGNLITFLFFGDGTHPPSPIFTDIFLRTLLLVVFSIALYSNVSLGHLMTTKRKTELVKRREMEGDFKTVVEGVLDVIKVFTSHKIHDEKLSTYRVAEMSYSLAKIMNLPDRLCEEIKQYAVIHVKLGPTLSIKDLNLDEQLLEHDYEEIRNRTLSGSVVIKRLQLSQKAEDIVKAHVERQVSSEFTDNMNLIQPEREAMIILICEMYDILRSERPYKHSMTHRRASDLLNLSFADYFDQTILDRFQKYNSELEAIYEDFKLEEDDQS
jgi:HD-GYP domain-containing protein (c-di-GMP phosphodiesterase class II)